MLWYRWREIVPLVHLLTSVRVHLVQPFEQNSSRGQSIFGGVGGRWLGEEGIGRLCPSHVFIDVVEPCILRSFTRIRLLLGIASTGHDKEERVIGCGIDGQPSQSASLARSRGRLAGAS